MKKNIILSLATILLLTTVGSAYAFSPMMGFGQDNEDVVTALQNNDYNAWKEAMGDHPMAEKITEENFEQFAEMHKLMQEGKTDEANQIREELGFGFKNGIGRGKGFNK